MKTLSYQIQKQLAEEAGGWSLKSTHKGQGSLPWYSGITRAGKGPLAEGSLKFSYLVQELHFGLACGIALLTIQNQLFSAGSFFLKFLFMCMWTYLCMPHVFRYLQRPEGVRFLTVGVTSGCRHPMSVLEIKLRFFGSMGGTEVPVLTDDKH